jgi:hypothetical protein
MRLQSPSTIVDVLLVALARALAAPMLFEIGKGETNMRRIKLYDAPHGGGH